MNRSLISFLKFLDKIAGPIFIRISIHRYKKTDKLKKILIVRPGGIGDAALLLPSIKRLKKMICGAEIDVLCEPRNIGTFIGSHYIDEVFSYWSVRDLRKLISREYDLIIDTEQSHLLSRFFSNSIIKAGKRAGFSSNGYKKHYEINVPYFHEEYEAYSFHRLFSRAIPKWEKDFCWDPPYIAVSDNEGKRIKDLTSFIKRPIALIFAGASINLRKWSPLRWARVSDGLWEMGFYPVLLGSEDEQAINRKISYYSKSPVMDLSGMLNLNETAELFRKSRLLISTDSGILHIAVIEGLNTVSLFGPGIADKWGPKGDGHIVVRKELECSPCTRFGYTPPCKKNALCMRLIKVEDVIDAIEKLISKGQK